MANLHFHYGTMSSSKSAQLLINAHNQENNDNAVELIKPTVDNRFSKSDINSRIGLSAPAMAMPNLLNYTPNKDTKMVLIDEVQFFTPADIDRLVKIADSRPIIIMCYGLMVDSNENIFPASRRLIEVGAKLHRMESTCQIKGCMHLATHHLRFDGNGNVIRDGAQVAVGDSCYKSVCRQHFNHLYRGWKIKNR